MLFRSRRDKQFEAAERMESEAETKLPQSVAAALCSKTFEAKLSNASAAVCASFTKSDEGAGGAKDWLEVSRLSDGAACGE